MFGKTRDLGLMVVALLLCGALTLAAHANTGTNRESSLTESCRSAAPVSSDECTAFVSHWQSDPKGLIQIGNVAIRDGHSDAVIRAYEIFLSRRSHSLPILKALVRARSHRRAQLLIGIATDSASIGREARQTMPSGNLASEKLIVGEPNVENAPKIAHQPDSTCWTQRWQEALDACHEELTRNGASIQLFERLGDLYRSLGRVDKAISFYRQSSNLGSPNAASDVKLSALLALVGKPPASELVHRQASGEAVVGQRRPTQKAAKIRRNQPVRRNPSVLSHAGGNRLALVIGNNRYDRFPRLQTAEADAALIARVLRDQYGFKVETLLNANRYDLVHALSRLRKQARADDDVLIYYAGHGILDDSTGRGYWLPIDAERDSIANWVSSTDISDTVKGMAARHVMVVADSCFAGSLYRNGLNVSLDERINLLRRLYERRSRTVLTSGGLEPVLDSGGGHHSVFARAFADALSRNTEVVEAGRVFESVRNQVVASADQTPQYAPLPNANHRGGDFLFVPIAKH